MDETTKEICTFYERNIIGTVDQHENVFTPDYNFTSFPSGSNSTENERQYKLFKAYMNSKRIWKNETQATDDGTNSTFTPSTRHYDSDNNLNNFTIQNFDDARESLLEESGTLSNDPVLDRHDRNMENIRTGYRNDDFEPLSSADTPLGSIYYNDPNYGPNIASQISPNSLPVTQNPRSSSTQVPAPSQPGHRRGLVSQQSSDSLLANSSSANDHQRSRPATKNDFVYHNVKTSDTLDRISIQYDVSKDAIRMANEFTGDEVYMFRVLKIPFTHGEVYHVPDEEQVEEKKKRWAKELLHQAISDYHRKNGNYQSEVRYYLEINDYDMDKAMREFQEDMRFEKQVKQDNKQFRRERKRQRWNDMGCGCLCFCFVTG